jgi:hypothetical protein
MSPAKKPNTGHSVFQRLLNHARAQGEDFNLLLFRYGVERLLYRLSISPYAEKLEAMVRLGIANSRMKDF